MHTALSSLDYHLILRATQWTASSPFLQTLVYIGAQLLILIFPVVLYILWYRPDIKSEKHGAQKAVVLAIFSVVLTLAVKTLIAFVFVRARPFVSHPDLLAMTFQVDAQSFPSAHAMLSFAVASSIYMSGYRKLGGILLVLAVIISISRVFAGVHYPSDVLGGALIGIASSFYLHRESSSLKRYLPNH